MNPVNLVINIAIPVVVLLTLSAPDRLGAIPALMLAIGIPAVWGVVELLRTRKLDASSVLGVLSVLATGIIGVFELSTRMFAMKEAAIPLIFGVVLIVSNATSYPIVTLLIDAVQRRERVKTEVDRLSVAAQYRKHVEKAGTIWASIMILSGVLKFALASFIVQSRAGTEAFNHELAQYELWQLPTTFSLTGVLILGLIWYIASGTSAITGLPESDILRGGDKVAKMARRLSPIANFYRSTPLG